MDGAHWWQYRKRKIHNRMGLLQLRGRIPSRQRGISYFAQLSHVQNVLLQIRPSLH